MRFLTVDTFIKEIIEMFPKAEDVYVSYIVKDAKDDQFGKHTSYPLLMVIIDKGDKKVFTYDKIVELFDGSIGITFTKPRIITEGIACYKISTKMEHSEKFDVDFFPRKSIAVSDNVIKTIKETKKDMIEKATPEILDI